MKKIIWAAFISILFLMFLSSFSEIKAKEFCAGLNVKEFGAKGDGVTDDTRSIQDAFDDAYKRIKDFKLRGGNPKRKAMIYCDRIPDIIALRSKVDFKAGDEATLLKRYI